MRCKLKSRPILLGSLSEPKYTEFIVFAVLSAIFAYWEKKINQPPIPRELVQKMSHDPKIPSIVALQEDIAALPKKKRQALVERLSGCITLEEMGRRMGVSTTQVCRLMKKLREHIERKATEQE